MRWFSRVRVHQYRLPKMREIPHNRLTFGDAECQAVLRTVRSGQWAQGPRVEELETVLARLGGVRHAVCVASGLAALRLALGALGVRSGERVLVPAYSCVALANAALAWGATPVPVDVEAVTWNIDATECKRHAGHSPARAVIAVNTFGAPAGVEEIGNTGLPVIEDCAHAFGAEVAGRRLGSRAQVGVLSFYATKLIGGGEGGALLTDSSEIANFAKSARDYGDQPADAHRLNDKMNELEASLVLAQLERLPDMIAARESLAARYLDRLANFAHGGVFRLPARGGQRIWYRFAVEMLCVPAETVIRDLQRCGVHAAVPVTDWRSPQSPAAPVADRAYQKLVSLPLYPTLTEEEQDVVVEVFLRLCEDYARA
jgi:dTDP-4-amino-4,6-dideoxygalactose transaminase